MTRAWGKRPLDRGDGLDLLLAGQHAALELEVVEAVGLVGGLGEAGDGLRRQGLLVPQAEPAVAGLRLPVGEVGAAAVADVEQVAQHLHGVPLLALAQQRGHRHVEVLAEKVEEGGFHRRHRVDGDSQVEGLEAAPAGIPVREAAPHRGEHPVPGAERLADHEVAGLLQHATDALAAGDLAEAGGAGGVGEHHKVAGEERAVRAGEVQQHAVASGDRHHLHVGHDGGVAGGVPGVVEGHGLPPCRSILVRRRGPPGGGPGACHAWGLSSTRRIWPTTTR